LRVEEPIQQPSPAIEMFTPGERVDMGDLDMGTVKTSSNQNWLVKIVINV